MLSKYPSIINNPSAIKADCCWDDKKGVLIIILVQVYDIYDLKHSPAFDDAKN